MPFPPRLPERALRWLLLPLLVVLLGQPLAFAAVPPQEAVFAGGCFWCLEHDLEGLEGVLDAESGYAGGSTANPSYHQVSAGGTGHAESVRVRFDPERISYPTLLRAFWRNVDPTDDGGQFCDRGSSYRPVIFTSGAQQEQQAQQSVRAAQQELGSDVRLKVAIKPLQRFWPAEDYHQDYAEHNPLSYRYYRWRCGRDARLDAVWGERARSAKVWFSPTATSANTG